MPLTLQQLNDILQQARANGLSEAEVDALAEALTVRMAGQDGAGKLKMTLDLTPPNSKQSMQAFVDDMAALRKDQMQRAADDIMGMSDAEWDAIMNGDDNAGPSTP